jgi:hypothetical protein
MKCTAVTKGGASCRAHAVSGKLVCVLHQAGAAQRLGAAGGRRRAVKPPIKLKNFGAPKSVAQVALVLAHTIAEVRSGKIDAKNPASVIARLSSVLCRALETSDLERRITALEERSGKR